MNAFLNIKYADRVLDLIVRCYECSNTKSLYEFKAWNLRKLKCSKCQSKKFKAFLPFRYQEFNSKNSVMNISIIRDKTVLELYKNPSKAQMVPDFVSDFTNTTQSKDSSPYSWDKFNKLPLVLYADSTAICKNCKQTFTQITLKNDEVLDNLNELRKIEEAKIDFQLMYCICNIRAEYEKSYWAEEAEYKQQMHEEMLSEEEKHQRGYVDESSPLVWDDENEEWSSEGWHSF